ncbi:MAG: hypothetical protein JWR19_497 [Pedosphaera sp.]|nr:hypothetical protein [Pedosphaera sp.]
MRGYAVTGNTLIPEWSLRPIFLKHIGTNLSLADIVSAASELQVAYRERGYPTVSVTLPQQQLTNGLVKIRVFEGTLAEVKVVKNRYFSTSNVLRALPSLTTGIILNSVLFQAELDRANANQDRQIYPEIVPGPTTNTSTVILSVKDRLPLHARLELNNQSSPGTPELRANSSAVYNNLWQLEHSVGLQYSFAPAQMKAGDDWLFYDRPLVANYSGFYRLPLSTPDALAEEVASRPGAFGYDEATRRFRLPAPTGVPELTFYGSRSTIDTSVKLASPVLLFSSVARSISRQDAQQDITINEGLGGRLTQPIPEFDGIRSVASLGLDFKKYRLTSYATNIFIFTEHLFDALGFPFDRVTPVPSPVPTTRRSVNYLPLSLRWDANRRDSSGSMDLGLSYSPNFSVGLLNNKSDFQNVAGSKRADGYYHIINASLTRDQIVYRDWRLLLHADGQWASEPLISNEQYGVGGVNSVRGYREGEQFGDTGWRVSAEQKTPPLQIGMVDGTMPMQVRASVFMDYGQSYLLDPNGRPGQSSLWGTGFGFATSIGTHWDGRLMFAWPLQRTATTEPGRLFISFGVNAQF